MAKSSGTFDQLGGAGFLSEKDAFVSEVWTSISKDFESASPVAKSRSLPRESRQFTISMAAMS